MPGCARGLTGFDQRVDQLRGMCSCGGTNTWLCRRRPWRSVGRHGAQRIRWTNKGTSFEAYKIESMRRLAGPELNEGASPDETTILKFRRPLEQHSLANALLWSALTLLLLPVRSFLEGMLEAVILR